jgi:hypothetical protein
MHGNPPKYSKMTPHHSKRVAKRAKTALQPEEMAFHAEEMALHAEEMALQPHDSTFQPEEMAFYPQSTLFHPAHLWRRLCRRGGSEEMAFQPEEMAFQPEEMAFRTARQSLMISVGNPEKTIRTHPRSSTLFPMVFPPFPLLSVLFIFLPRSECGGATSTACIVYKKTARSLALADSGVDGGPQ